MPAFLASLGRPFIANAFRRLSDQFYAGSSVWFVEFGIQAPVRTATEILLLRAKGPLGITEIAGELHQSHPTIIAWTRELEKLGLVKSSAHAKDKRRNVISLTRAGEADAERIAAAQPLIERAYLGLCEEVGSDVFDALLQLEQACDRKPMLQRLREAQQESQEDM